MSITTKDQPTMVRFGDFCRNHCSPATARRWRREGLLRAYRIGGLVYVTETYDQFIARQISEQQQALERQEKQVTGEAERRGTDRPTAVRSDAEHAAAGD